MIQKIIKVPKEIITAVNENNLAVFIGAGVSRIVGCKGWNELAKRLVKLCFNLKKQDDSTCINFKEKNRLLEERDHKKTITICYEILEINGYGKAFYKELEKSLRTNDRLLNEKNIYKEIIGLHGLFITTNADRLFDSYFLEDRIIYNETDINPENIDRNKLYHIHGSTLGISSLVFTVPQYIKRYNNPNFKQFLEEIFKQYTVLFLGYGLAEFELLDFLILKYGSNEKNELKHFIINPYYRGEENILKFDQYYYGGMGINVLGYELDEKGYGQLYDILKEWNTEINQTSIYLHTTYERIEKAVLDYNKEAASEILQIIKNDKPQENHLFHQLAKSENAMLWLDLLYKHNYFQPENNPAPSKVSDKQGFYTIKNWNILDYLLNVARLNQKRSDKSVTKLLETIVNNIIDYRISNGKIVDNSTTDGFIVQILFLLPNELIAEKHINWLYEALQAKWIASNLHAHIGRTVFPSLIQNDDKENILSLLEKILHFKRGKRPASDKFEPILEKYWLKKALKRHKEAIAAICGIKAAKIAIQKMKKVTAEDDSAFHYMWIPTIENHQQTRFTDKYECQLVHFVRDILTYLEPKNIKSLVKELLKEGHPIFRRIAIHLIDVNYIELNDIFWELDNPLNDEMLEHESYELLKNNCSVFTKPQIEKIMEWIEAAGYQVSNIIKDDKEKIEKAVAHQKKEWLSAMLNTNNPEVELAYQKYNVISPSELKHPGHRTWSESFIGTVSPIEPEELIKKTNSEIAAYLNEFKSDGHWGSPSEEGLSSTFKSCIKSDPEKFTRDLKPFETVSQSYQYDLVSGFAEAWRLKKTFSWENVLKFIEKNIKGDDFWNKKYEDGRANCRSWIISQILDLVQEGTKTDSNAFDPKYLSQAEKILFLIAEKIDVHFYDIKNLYKAMIQYSLRYARINKKNDKERWPLNVKNYFSKILNKEIETTKDFYKVLGELLANLIYLDKAWVIKNINMIFPPENEVYWKSAFSSHVKYTHKVYQEIYFMLKNNGIWSKAFEHSFEDEIVMEHTIQHICVSYMEGWEDLNDSDSLINFLIKRKNPSELHEIVRYIGTFGDNFTDEKKNRVNNLWKAIYKIVVEQESKREFQLIISDLCSWIALIDEIDEDVFEWLKLSARYVEVNYNSPHFIENLKRLVKINPKEAGAIYIEILKSKVYPNFEEEHIKRIVKVLYDKGQKEDADRIHTIYMANGYDFLKPIYEKYQKGCTRKKSRLFILAATYSAIAFIMPNILWQQIDFPTFYETIKKDKA